MTLVRTVQRPGDLGLAGLGNGYGRMVILLHALTLLGKTKKPFKTSLPVLCALCGILFNFLSPAWFPSDKWMEMVKYVFGVKSWAEIEVHTSPSLFAQRCATVAQCCFKQHVLCFEQRFTTLCTIHYALTVML